MGLRMEVIDMGYPDCNPEYCANGKNDRLICRLFFAAYQVYPCEVDIGIARERLMEQLEGGIADGRM